MTVTTNDLNSYAGIVEYSYTGETTDDVTVSITATGAHFQILQIAFSPDSVGVASEEFNATINHNLSTSLDTEFFGQDMAGQTEVLQRWANDSGIYIPKGTTVDFTWTNTDASDWGLSVMVRAE